MLILCKKLYRSFDREGYLWEFLNLWPQGNKRLNIYSKTLINFL